MKKKGKIKKQFKKMKGTSNLEVKFVELLDNLKLNYEPHFTFKKREFDFLLTDYNILVETHGCFFHCCKQHNPVPKYAFQRRSIKNDQYKVKIVKFDQEYDLLVVWEHEMENTKLLTERVLNYIIAHTELLQD